MTSDTMLALACLALPVLFPALRWSRWLTAPFRFLAYCFSDENKECEPPAWTRS